jgi:hypothetical protein
LSRVIPILFGAVFTVAACTSAGLLLLRQLRLNFDRAEQLLFGFLSGAACLSTFVFLLCVVHQARTGIFLIVGAALIAVARPLPAAPRKALPRLSSIYFVLLGSVFLLYFFNALAPEVSPDGSGYHLGNVIRIYERHGFVWDYQSLYSWFPQGLEMLFLVAYSLGGMPAAAMVHFAFLCALAGLLICHGRRMGFPKAGLFAAVLVFASPVVGLDGVSAYNDVALATCIYAVFYLAEVFREEAASKALVLCGLLAGFSFAIKYTGWMVLPYAAVAVGNWRVLPYAAAVAGPWLVRNSFWVGNPVAPFLNRWFPNSFYSVDLEVAYVSDLRHIEGFHHWWEVPLDLAIYGAKLPGFVGPVFLLAPIALLALRYPIGRRLLGAAVIFSLPVWLNPSARFLIPGIPFLAMAMALAMQHSPGVLPALAGFHCLLAAPAVMPGYCADWAWRLRSMPVRVALGRDPEDPYIRRFVPDYGLKKIVEEYIPKDKQIFSFATRPEAYLDRRIIVGYESAGGTKIAETIRQGAKPPVDFVLVNDRDFSSAAIKNNTNLAPVSESNGTTLYRVD